MFQCGYIVVLEIPPYSCHQSRSVFGYCLAWSTTIRTFQEDKRKWQPENIWDMINAGKYERLKVSPMFCIIVEKYRCLYIALSIKMTVHFKLFACYVFWTSCVSLILSRQIPRVRVDPTHRSSHGWWFPCALSSAF